MNLTVTGKYLDMLWTPWYLIFLAVISTFNQEKKPVRKHLKWSFWGVWQAWTLPLQRHRKVHLSKKEVLKGWLQIRIKCALWPSLLLVLLGLGDLETETNTTCFYCWDQVLFLHVKASLVLFLWWDLPLWDKKQSLGQNQSLAEGVQGWDSKSWNFIANVTATGACCSDQYWYLTLPTCTKCPRRCCLTSPLTSSFPAQGELATPWIDCRFMFLLVNSSEPVFPRQGSANPSFPAHSQWDNDVKLSLVPPRLLGSFSVGITPVRAQTLPSVLCSAKLCRWTLSFVQRRSQAAVMPSLVYSWAWSVSMEWASWDLILLSGSLLTLELSLQGKTLLSGHAFCFGRQRVTAVFTCEAGFD